MRPSWTGSTLSINGTSSQSSLLQKLIGCGSPERVEGWHRGVTQDKRGTPRGHSGVSSHIPHGTKTTHGPELTLEERREPRRLRREKQRENNVDRAAKMHAARLKMEATSLKTTAKHPSSFRATLPVTTGADTPCLEARAFGRKCMIAELIRHGLGGSCRACFSVSDELPRVWATFTSSDEPPRGLAFSQNKYGVGEACQLHPTKACELRGMRRSSMLANAAYHAA